MIFVPSLALYHSVSFILQMFFHFLSSCITSTLWSSPGGKQTFSNSFRDIRYQFQRNQFCSYNGIWISLPFPLSVWRWLNLSEILHSQSYLKTFFVTALLCATPATRQISPINAICRKIVKVLIDWKNFKKSSYNLCTFLRYCWPGISFQD